RDHHARRTLPDDRPRAGDRGDHGRQEGRPDRSGHVPDQRSALHRPARRRGRDRRRAHLLPRPRARPRGRALPGRRREALLETEASMAGPRAKAISLFDRGILLRAAVDSIRKLAPHLLARNPVMFVVEVGSVLTTVVWLRDVFAPAPDSLPTWFSGAVAGWLWFTVLFANYAESVAEGRGKAPADTLRRMRKETTAHRRANGRVEEVSASQLRKGDVVVVSAGELVPGDGDVIEGIASVDESAVTGESAPVIRESGGD